MRSFGLFSGYLNDPEKTAAAFDADGWYRTGDRGALDADGRLRFLGRLKDMLKVGGENVAAAEIESLLSTHPRSSSCRSSACPTRAWRRFRRRSSSCGPAHEATADELIAFCGGAIARFKVPRHVRFVSEWPMSATKIQKGPLRERLIAESQATETKQTVA